MDIALKERKIYKRGKKLEICLRLTPQISVQQSHRFNLILGYEGNGQTERNIRQLTR